MPGLPGRKRHGGDVVLREENILLVSFPGHEKEGAIFAVVELRKSDRRTERKTVLIERVVIALKDFDVVRKCIGVEGRPLYEIVN